MGHGCGAREDSQTVKKMADHIHTYGSLWAPEHRVGGTRAASLRRKSSGSITITLAPEADARFVRHTTLPSALRERRCPDTGPLAP